MASNRKGRSVSTEGLFFCLVELCLEQFHLLVGFRNKFFLN
jgi:hypothetical protein